ncbi:MAG: PEP-CTERM sorting domain-containing protein [Pirellulales bacterium]
MATVPEPSTFALAALGILGVFAYVRRKPRRTCGA